MTRSITLIIALAATASAATTSSVASLFLPLVDPQPLVASIVGVDSAATTYLYSCAPGTDPDECGLTASETITQGPTTAVQTYTAKPEDGGFLSQVFDCKLDSEADLATCTVEASQSDSETDLLTTMSDSVQYLSHLLPATVTAGFEKLHGDATATTSGTKPTATGEDGSSITSSGAEPTASGEEGSSSTSSPNAAPAVTQQAFFAGVAAVVGAFAL